MEVVTAFLHWGHEGTEYDLVPKHFSLMWLWRQSKPQPKEIQENEKRKCKREQERFSRAVYRDENDKEQVVQEKLNWKQPWRNTRGKKSKQYGEYIMNRKCSGKEISLYSPVPLTCHRSQLQRQHDRFLLTTMIKSWHIVLAITVNQEQLSKITMNNEGTCTQR